MYSTKAYPGSPVGVRWAGPSNVIPFLTAVRPPRSASPLELAAALRRLHAVGLRRGFVLVAPTPLAHDTDVASRTADSPVCDLAWWTELCDAIRVQTSLRVALIDLAPGEMAASAVCEQSVPRARVVTEIPDGARAALIELSRGVCTGDPGLLAEAREMGIPAIDPAQFEAAAREGTLSHLLERPITEALPASA